ncbi:MAG: hypothetical protein ACYDBQ_07085 [Thermoplasmatota archaeon]
MPLRALVAVTGAFEGRLRVRRSTGALDTEGVERVLSETSARAITLARQLVPHGATLVAAHVDKGGGEEVLREALSYGLDQGILIEPTGEESDASGRAATLAEVVRQFGPFDLVVGPGRSEFAGFNGTMAGLAGLLDLPVVVGVRELAPDGQGFRIRYESLFGDYDLHIPRPSVVIAGDVPPHYPTAWDIHDAHRVRGILRLKADRFLATKPLTRRIRIESAAEEVRTLESVDGPSLVRRMRSRALIGEAPKGA